MADPTPTQRQPVDISVYTRRQELEIAWGDGHRSSFGFEPLRWLCPCAVCRGEAGGTGMLDHTAALRPEQYRLVDLAEVGNYAVCPRWQDGHDTGIYAWEYLRRNCPCATCAGTFRSG